MPTRIAGQGRTRLRPLRASARLVLIALTVCCMAPAIGADAKKCLYLRIGTMPVEWRGARLRVQGSINETPVPMIVDTGATNVIVPMALADQLSLPVIESIQGEAYGTGGVAKVSVARTATMAIGNVRGVGLLMRVDMDSVDHEVLVGGDFLFQHDLELNDHEMAFFEPTGCGDVSLAYWDPLTPFAALEDMDEENRSPVVRVSVNGHVLRALVDTGAPVTLLDLGAARKLGVDPAARGTKPYEGSGVGTHQMAIWPPEQFNEFEIGGEIVKKPRIAIADVFGNARKDMWFLGWWRLRNAPDMVLGADFLRAHRLLFSPGQHRMYLSYTGGNVFNAPTKSDLAAAVEPVSTVP